MYGESFGQIKRTVWRIGYGVFKNNAFYLHQDGTSRVSGGSRGTCKEVSLQGTKNVHEVSLHHGEYSVKK